MTSLAKMLSILDLFAADQPQWSAEAVCDALAFSRPTGYRYVKELVDAGLLQRVNNGQYVLGPRIILLDYQIRMADPVLRAAIPQMRELVEQTGCDCVISAIFGHQLLDIHRESGNEVLDLSYGRGRPRPLFQGAAPKALLSALPRTRLKKIYDSFADEIAQRGLGEDWNEFRTQMAKIRKAGFYVSLGELECDLSAIAAPLMSSETDVMGALSLVTSTKRMELMDRTLLTELIQRYANFISAQIAAGSAAPAKIEAMPAEETLTPRKRPRKGKQSP
ncbi:MAG: IclR family transcriptional regulator [Zoogloea sp.]|uniref:IclR family transcriptional regulator n=1 Tax=Zoogloea sp. TaxID=49181 RepID=UPI003F320C0A